MTANYHQLQGLRFVPLGMFLLVWGVLGFLGTLDAGDELSRLERTRVLTRVGLVFWLALLSSLAAAMIGYLVLARMDMALHWPVALHLLLVAAALFITVWSDGPVRFHYLLPASVWLAYSFLPGLAVSAADIRSVTLVLGGLTLITCGLGDHLVLTRTLTKPSRTDDVSQSATV